MASRYFAADTECDLAIGAADQSELCKVLADLRLRLMAEHLGQPCEIVEAKINECDGHIHRTIEQLCKSSGRTLCVLEARELNDTERALAESRLMDPEEPIAPSRRVMGFVTSAIERNRAVLIAGTLAAASVAAWRAFSRR